MVDQRKEEQNTGQKAKRGRRTDTKASDSSFGEAGASQGSLNASPAASTEGIPSDLERASGSSPSEFNSRLSESGNKVKSTGKEIYGRMRERVPVASREIFSRYDQSARSSPWVHIGFVGLGAMFIGYALGRSSSPRRVSVIRSRPSYSTEMGRGYEDFDDALDE